MGFTYYDSDAIRQHDQESLQHYGVLGMKWGERRFQNKDGSLTAAGKKHYEKTGEYGYKYHSHATKKYQRKAARAERKALKIEKKMFSDDAPSDGKASRGVIRGAKKIEKLGNKFDKYSKRAERSAELDAREQAAAKKISTGKAIVSRLLVGGTASKAYQQYNAMAGGNPGAATKGVSAVKAYYGGTLGSRAAKAAYIRKGEKDHGIVNRINKNMEKENKALQAADREAERRKKKWKNG